MKCPGCGGEVPHVALKCKHCGEALKKQAPPAAKQAAKPAAKPARPEDPLRALAKEALAQQKSKQGPPAGGRQPEASSAKAGPPRKKTPTGSLAPGGEAGPAGDGPPGEPLLAPPPPDPRRRLLLNAGVGVAVALAAAIGWRTDAAQAYVTNWAAGTAVRDVPFEVLDGEYLGAGDGQLRVPEGFKVLPDMPAGTRGLGWEMHLELVFRGGRDAAFTMVGKQLKYEEALAGARALDPRPREFNATYGKNAFRSIRYKQPPAEDAPGPPRTLRFYQSKHDGEHPFTLEFGYEESEQNKVIIDKLIDRILTSIVE